MCELELEILKKLGTFTSDLRDEVKSIIKEGISALEIVEFMENKIFDAGYLPAFPATVCINNQAAHFTIFDEEIILKKGDVVKVDFGVSKDGNITDNAFTIEIGTNKYKTLLESNEKALNEELEAIQSGIEVSKIGAIADKIAKDAGFNTIHNLSGHQISKNDLHAGLSIPNFDNTDSTQIPQTAEIAIEPFFSTGTTRVKSGGPSNILHLVNNKQVRDIVAKKVLDYIKEHFPHLPFSKRWLLKEFDKRKVLYALRTLKLNKIIYEYDMLVSEDGSIISQFEHTVVFKDGEKSIITRDENERS
ncbi:MAG: type II methionyl aminopeptidase [Nanoarchaeota archaeon]